MSVHLPERTPNDEPRSTAQLKAYYDFIVCGSGSAGSVVAGRLAENPNVDVLLLEAGGDDEVAAVMQADQWPSNLGSERDWGFRGRPNSHLNGRSLLFSMGKVLGGGSSVNVMTWARGHKRDWDFFAAEARDPAWNYEAVLGIYRRIEDWHGAPDPQYRGTGGPVFVEPAAQPDSLAPAILEGARSLGIPTFENPNGRLMEADCGASMIDLRVRDGKRQSVFRSYVFPRMGQPNLTVLKEALVTRVIFEGKRASGVEIYRNGSTQQVRALFEVVLSLGAIHTPKVLMQSGVGNQAELGRFSIPVVQHLPGVGRNLQDHVGISCIWEFKQPLPARTVPEVMVFGKSDAGLNRPDLFACQGAMVLSTDENAARFDLPASGWTLFGSVSHPKSRGSLRLTGPGPFDPIDIEPNTLAEPEDLKGAVACVELLRGIGNSAPLGSLVKREVMPGDLKATALRDFIRNAATTYWHPTCTAKIGRDDMSVVDGSLRVYGVDNLTIADGSIMPRITTANTMAPCVIIGERAAEILRQRYKLGSNDGD
jgi:choline dehydrogenase